MFFIFNFFVFEIQKLRFGFVGDPHSKKTFFRPSLLAEIIPGESNIF